MVNCSPVAKVENILELAETVEGDFGQEDDGGGEVIGAWEIIEDVPDESDDKMGMTFP